MLYRPVWLFCVILYRIFFRHFYLKNRPVDLSKPTIIVSNHNNAFIDPIIYPALILQRIYFIVRGDIFNTPLNRWLLWNLGQIPMFRIRDGVDNVKKNEGSFEQCFDLLARKENIEIFPEGDCVQKKRLRKLKKGTARMAFGAVEKHGWDLDLKILPLLNNYTYPRQFRTEVMVNIGETISLNDYKALYLEDENKALNKLTADIYDNMKREYIHIDNEKNDNLFEQLVILKRNNIKKRGFPWLQKNTERFDMEKNLANTLNEMAMDSAAHIDLIEKTATYFEEVQKQQLSDRAINGKTPNLILGGLLTVLGFPVYALGIILNLFQFNFANQFAEKKIKQVIFKNSIRFGFLMATNLIVGLVLIVAVGFTLGWEFALFAPIVQFLLAYYTINYHEYVQSWQQTVEVSKLNSKKKESLKADRHKILALLD